MSGEIKLIEEFRPLGCGYFVSNMGRVIGNKGKDLTPFINKGGYAVYNMGRIRRPQSGLGHRLVAAAFVPNLDPTRNIEVDHINGVKLDNRASNLRWVDTKTNARAKYELRKRLGLPLLNDKERSAVKAAIRKTSKPVLFRGQVYPSLNECGRSLNLRVDVIWKALKRGVLNGEPIAYALAK